MNTKQRHALIIGAVVGVALFAFFYYYSQNLACLALIPVGAVMGAAPQFLKPADMEEDD